MKMAFSWQLRILLLSASLFIFPRVRPNVTEELEHSRVERQAGIGGGAATPGTPYPTGQCIMCPAGMPGSGGPPGQPGIPGRDGRDGRDGRPGGPTPPDASELSNDQGCRPASGGAIYVRWGRNVCPGDSVLVYSGIAGGSFYSETGGASNYLCMPSEPIYDNPAAGVVGARGYIYGAEYQIYSLPTWNGLHDHDVPCAVCLASSRPTSLMIPARNICPRGDDWVLEYSGFLMSANHQHPGRTEYICMDRRPEIVHGTPQNADGVLFFLVESRCGRHGNGLPCGPYVDGYELTCAVCTK